MAFKLRVSLLHMVNNEIGNLIEERALKAKCVVPLINRTPHNLTKHVIAAFVSRQNSVSNRKGCRTRVICNHAHGEALLCFGFVVSICETSGEIDYWPNEIRIVV